VAIGLLLIGPAVMDIVFGSDASYGRVGLAVIALGMGFHLCAGTLNQAALARGHDRAAAGTWLVAAAVFVAWMLSPLVDDQGELKKEPVKGKAGEKDEKEEVEGEFAKDGVSLDELFTLKPEIFQTATPGTEEDAADKKKGKKGKKKSVELEFDEERGEVVGRKKHKRGDDDLGQDW